MRAEDMTTDVGKIYNYLERVFCAILWLTKLENIEEMDDFPAKYELSKSTQEKLKT